MYCKHCGAAAIGKYCSCCGRRLRNSVEEFNLAQDRLHKDFYKKAYMEAGKSLEHQHLASACWIACELKYLRNRYANGKNGELVLAPDAWERLELVHTHAAALYERIKAEGF